MLIYSNAMTPKSVQKLSRTLLCILCSLVCLSCGPSEEAGSNTKPKLPFGFTDFPRPGETVQGSVGAAGWALSEVGIKEVCFYIDRSFVKCTGLGAARPDVTKAHPGVAKNDNSGWEAIMETSFYSPGLHELTVQAIDNNGSIREIGNVSFTVAP